MCDQRSEEKYISFDSTDSGFLSGCSSTFSSSSEYFSKYNSEDNMSISYDNDFDLASHFFKLSLEKNSLDMDPIHDSKIKLEKQSEMTSESSCEMNCDSGIVSMIDSAEQKPWEQHFSQNEDGDTLLHTAIIAGYLEASLSIIKTAPHPCLLDTLNDNCQSALQLAVLTKQPKIVRNLVLAGADLSIRNHQGNTALHLACISQDLECAKVLTEPIRDHEKNSLSQKQFNVSQNLELRNYNGETCLHIAASKNNVELVRLLIHLGADVEAQDYLGGRTALHLALELGCLQTFLFLVQECQAQLDATTYSGYSVRQLIGCVDEHLAKELIVQGVVPQTLLNATEDLGNPEFKEMSTFVTPTFA